MVGEMNKQVFQPSKSKVGDMDAKWMILIAYFGAVVLGFISGAQFLSWLIPLIVYLIDKENKFIAFHAMQAFLMAVTATVIYIILAIIMAISIVGAATSAAFALNPYAFGASFGAIMAITAIIVIVGVIILIFSILAVIKGFKYEIYEVPLWGKWAEKIVFKTSK